MNLLDPRQVLQEYILNDREGKCVPLDKRGFTFRILYTSRMRNINTLIHFDQDLNGYQAVTPLGRPSINTQRSREIIGRWFLENHRRELTYKLNINNVIEVRACRSRIPRKDRDELISVYKDTLGRTALFVDQDLPRLQAFLKSTSSQEANLGYQTPFMNKLFDNK